MTHDPLCIGLRAYDLNVFYNGPMGGSDHIRCLNCYYIAKVRADERSMCAGAGQNHNENVMELTEDA